MACLILRHCDHPAIAFRLSFIAACILIGGCGIWPTPVPPTEPALIVLPEIYEGGQTIPNDISADGKVVVGTCVVPSVVSGQPTQAQAFRWSHKDGLVPMGFLPDKPLTFALATNHDGSIIVGYAADPDDDTEQAWIWTAAKGMEAIPSPSGVNNLGLLRDGAETEAYDVTDDGVVFGGYAFVTPDGGVCQAPFLWSYDNGYGDYPLDGWGGMTDWVVENPAAIAADGFSLVFDRFSSAHNDDAPNGAWIAEFGLPFGSGNWIQFSAATADAPPFTPSARAYTSRPRIIAGSSIRVDSSGTGWSIPALWTSATGLLILDDGAPGAAMCVSPDGTWAGGGNYDAGTAFVWNASFGLMNLVVYLQQLDWTLGTNLYEQFEEAGLPSNVLGIAAGNKRMVGTAGSSAFGNPCRGFILDLPY